MKETLVYYWVPVDGDRESKPNVYLLHESPDNLCVGDILRSFPLPGTYHFRFKTAFRNGHGKLFKEV